MTTMASVMASGVTRKIGDHTYEFRPLTMKDIGLIQRQALDEFKRERIKTFSESIGLFPETERVKILRDVVDDTSKLSEADLPPKAQMIDEEGNVTLDKDRTVKTNYVDYPQWWMSSTYPGALHAVWLSLRHAQPKMKLEEVERLIMDNAELLQSMAETVADLSLPKLGNVEAVQAA